MKRLSKSKSDGKVSMFVGMDLHKNYLQIAVMNKEGRVLRNSKIDNNLKEISGFFNDIDDKAHVDWGTSILTNTFSNTVPSVLGRICSHRVRPIPSVFR